MTAATAEPGVATAVLIDDTPHVRLLLRMALQRAGGFEVVGEAGDGLEGVEQTRHHQPSLVLLDLAMPVMDGLEALPLIRSASPDSTVLVLSAFESARMARLAVDRGAAGYIQKGTPLDAMITTIRDALRDSGRHLELPVAAATVGVDPRADADELRSALAIAVHEMRNPLNVVNGMAMLLTDRQTLDDATIDTMVDTITSQGQVLHRVVQDLSTTIQIQHANLAVARQSVDLSTAIPDLLAMMRVDHAVQVSCPPGLRVCADPIRLQQIVTNLVSNAMKYGGQSARIMAERRGADVEIRVVDQGPGVPATLQPTMFDEFTRDAAAGIDGLGLGLHIVRSLTEALGGRAWHVPTPGGGATICLTLPADAETALAG